MKTFYEYYLGWARKMTSNTPDLKEEFRNELSNAIARDDRKSLLAFANSWPELLTGESAEFTHYFPPHQMAICSSRQTVNLLAGISKEFLSARNSYGQTFAHYAAIYARADIVECIKEIQADALLVKNDDGETPFDLLAQSLEEKAVSIRKNIKPSISEPS